MLIERIDLERRALHHFSGSALIEIGLNLLAASVHRLP
jgi:hypothetical protein